MMTKREAMIGTAAMALSALIGASAALANLYESPGWKDGRSNCGPATSRITHERACRKCCDKGPDRDAAPISQDEVDNCYKFCTRACWDCRRW